MWGECEQSILHEIFKELIKIIYIKLLKAFLKIKYSSYYIHKITSKWTQYLNIQKNWKFKYTGGKHMHRMFLHFCLEFSSMIAEYRYR